MNALIASQRKGRTPGFPLWLPLTLVQENLRSLASVDSKKVTCCAGC